MEVIVRVDEYHSIPIKQTLATMISVENDRKEEKAEKIEAHEGDKARQ